MARVGVTLGAGVNITPELGVDAYYSYVGFIGRDSTGPDAALARYWGDLHLVGLTLRLVVVNDVPEPAHETLDEPRPASTEERSEAAQLGEPTPATEAQPDAP